MHGLAIDRIFVERAVSGSVPVTERPEGKALFALLEKGDVVMAPKLDRLFRSALDALVVVEDLTQARRRVAPARPRRRHLEQWPVQAVPDDRRRLRRGRARPDPERVGQSKADQKARGRFLGGTVPFGYRRAGEDGEFLVPHEAEQEAIREIKRLKAQGKALRAISEAMKAKGFVISHEGVSRVLKAQRAA